MNSKTQSIMQALKLAVSATGLTQAYLAKQMKVSLPTVKRWFSGEGVSLDTVLKILEITGNTFADLDAILSATETKQFEYTIEQEKFLSKNPSYLAFFDQLLLGHSPKKIKSKYKLNDKSMSIYLSNLEKIGLIEVWPQDRVKFCVEGSPKWRTDGPLDQTLGKQIFKNFTDRYWSSGEIQLYLHRYSEEDFKKLSSMITDVKVFAKQANHRSKLLGTKERNYGFVISLEKFRAPSLTTISNIRGC